jgi:hypothetical protein
MKKVIAIIAIGVLLSFGLFSDAFCASSGGHGGSYSGGGYRGGGYSGSGYHGGAYAAGAYRAGGYYGYRGGGYYGYRGYYGGWRGGYYRPYYGWYGGFGPWWGYPYAYPDPYAYPYAYPSYPPVVTEPPLNAQPQEDSYWYFCEEKQAYYPYVASCPGGWTRVVPAPSQPGKEGVTQ